MPGQRASASSPSVCHQSDVALILVDVIKHFEFPDGSKVLRNALPIAVKLARLKRRARAAGVPTIYVNDNFGQWRSDATTLVAYCQRAEAPGAEFVGAIKPDAEDYFVLKPMHTLLRYLNASSLILAGLATDSCILFTAHDAKMRDFQLVVPPDCCAARTRREHDQAIEHIQRMGGARAVQSGSIRF